MSDDLKHLDEHVRACMVVFGSLLVLTFLTVAATYLDVPKAAVITLALCIATVKGSMVVLYFMHLVSEKKLIFISLALTGFFFIVLMMVPFAGHYGTIEMLVPRSH